MGNHPSLQDPGLFDTSLEDWYGTQFGGLHHSGSDDWADEDQENDHYQNNYQHEQDDFSETKRRYEKDVRENPVLGLDNKGSSSSSYDEDIEPLVETTAAVFHMKNMTNQGEENTDEDASVSQAVFEHLEEEARQGNHEPIVKILETAAAVGQALKQSFSQASDNSTDIFQVLSDGQMIDKSQPAAVFELLEKVKSIDEEKVNKFSSTVFKMLDEARSFGVQPVEERKLNIFRMLEETKPKKATSNGKTVHFTEEEDEEEEDESYYGSAGFASEEYPEVKSKYLPPTHDKKDSFALEDSSIIDNISEAGKSRSIPIQTMEGDSIDLVFVQDFDQAFNEFIGQNPKFLRKSPDLVHNIRVAKLQSLLAYLSAKEREHLTEIAKAKANKKGMEDSYKTLLREAIRGKAARQIYFQAELEKLAVVSKTLEAKLKWTSVALAEARVKRHQLMRQRYAGEKPDNSCLEVIDRLPKDVPGQNVRATIESGDSDISSMTETEKSEAIRKLQVDVAFLTSETKIWLRKLEILEKERQKVSWIESLLHKISEKQMKRLKSKFQKKVGVQFE